MAFGLHDWPGDGVKKILSSSKSLARSHFVLGGLDLEVGSLKETTALKAFRNKQLISFTKTQVLVEAIVYAGHVVASMLAKDATAPGPDRINDLMANLRELLFPEMGEDKEEKAKKAMKVVEKEIAKGPFKVEGMTYGKKKR